MTVGTNDHALRVDIDSGSYHLSKVMRERMDGDLHTLRKMIEDFPTSDLKVEIDQQHGTIHLSTSLRLANHTLYTGDADDQLHPAWERCIRKLMNKVRAFKERLANKDEYTKEADGTSHKVRPSMDPDAAALDEAIAQLDYPAFRDALAVYDEAIEKRIGRIVQRHPATETALEDGLTISTIMEEVFLNAFERAAHRPMQVPLGQWLEDLIEPSISILERHPDEERANIELVQAAKEAIDRQASSRN